MNRSSHADAGDGRVVLRAADANCGLRETDSTTDVCRATKSAKAAFESAGEDSCVESIDPGIDVLGAERGGLSVHPFRAKRCLTHSDASLTGIAAQQSPSF